MLLLGLALTYVGAPLGFARLLGRFRPAIDAPLRLALGAALSPITVAWVLWMLYALTPERPDGYYLAMLLVPLAVLSAYGGPLLRHRDLWARRHDAAPLPWLRVLLWVCVAGLIASVLVQAVVLPLTQNDPLEYTLVGRLLYTDASLVRYPVAAALDAGLYAPASHPPAYHLTLSWLFLLQGGGESTFIVRIVAVFHTLVLARLLFLSLVERSTARGVMGLLLLFTTPLMVLVTVIYHVDPLRITVLYAGLLMVRWAWMAGGRGPVLVAGATMGLAVFAHSIGLIAVPLLLGAAMFTGPRAGFGRRLKLAVVTGLLALVIGGGQFAMNTVRLGAPVADDVPVWEVEQIGEVQDLRYRRELVTPAQRLVNGVLGGFSDTALFGFSLWLAVAGAAVAAFRRSWSQLEIMSALMLLEFHLLALLTSVVGLDLVIKNSRYTLTIFPFAVVLGARALEEGYRLLSPRRGDGVDGDDPSRAHTGHVADLDEASA